MNEQNEDDPKLRLSFEDGYEVICTRENTTLFTFLGELSSRDHVFVQTQPTDPETKIAKGTYIFRAAEVFEQLAAYLWENDYPLHLNETSIAECDEMAYQTYIDQQANSEQAGDFVPDDWGL